MEENNELDIVEFVDDEGNVITMDVVDYLFYEGKEYALVTEHAEVDVCDGCAETDCEGCEDRKEAYIMEIVPAGKDENGDEMEEFVPVEDEALSAKLIDIFENSEFDDIYEDDEEDAEDDE